jgi:hypothetical protein
MIPRVNGGINIQPIRHVTRSADGPLAIGPDAVETQLRLVYELGFSALRITLTFEHFGPDFFSAIPYVRAARALGIDVIGVLADFEGLDLMRMLVEPQWRQGVLDAYLTVFAGPVDPATAAVTRVGSFSLQVLNEPTHFFGIDPATYVRQILVPVYERVKARDPNMTVVAAAAVGNIHGVTRMRQMINAGLEDHCDRVAFHVYSELLIPRLSGLARRPVIITESGADGPSHHLRWVRDVFPQIREGVGGTEEIFYFDLVDNDPNRWRVIDLQAVSETEFDVISESPELLRHWQRRVHDSLGGRPHALFESLIPSMQPYYTTLEDEELIASTQLLL